MNLLRAASIVSLLTLASRITGLGRELIIAAMFGAGAWTDAYNVAFRIPNLLRRLFAEARSRRPSCRCSAKRGRAKATR